ncbi:MAG: ketopantoate reductase family protein [Anaerovoracaceae bacterium]|jgi:2-dehydropantoate 2-reductase
MRIVIIGAGAMGCLYGGKLSTTEANSVSLLDVWEEHVAAINKGGLYMEEDGKQIHYTGLRASVDPKEIGHADLVIVFVKSIFTAEAVRDNKAVFGPNTVALTLQNGIGNVDQIAEEIGIENVIAGTTAHGATMLGPGHVRHAGSGKTIIGELDGSVTPRLEAIRNTLNLVGMETAISTNVMGLVWDKLLVNAGINALTGITGLQNGQILNHPSLLDVMDMAVLEGEAVARAKGVAVGETHPAITATEHIRVVAQATSANRSSMLQDILGGKKTEIETINGAIVDEGKRLGVPTPVNLVLMQLIRFYEEKRGD